MDTNNQTALQQEWTTLQFQYDSYEKFSLLIKVFSILVCSLLLFHEKLDFMVPILCLILWMLDGIWKTFQSRISERLLAVEKALLNPLHDKAMQYNTQWEFSRPKSTRLVVSYVTNALTPTVSIPHIFIAGVAVVITYLY